MPGEPRPVYWDACVLLSYINEVTERVSVIDELLRQSRAGEVRLLTSALSQVEVAFAASEKEQAALDPEVEQRIAELWTPGSPITPVEFYDLIGDRARALMRQGISQGWGRLSAADAIHLATAQQMAVEEFHTYDGDLLKWSGHVGFPVTEPETIQGQLGTG